MDNTVLYNLLVGSASKSIDQSKYTGKLNMIELNLLNMFGQLLNDFDETIAHDDKNLLKEAIRIIRAQNEYICDYKNSYTTLTGENIINIAPVVSNISITVPELTYTFKELDFTSVFSDSNNDNINKVKITTLPTDGTLTYNAYSVEVGDEIYISNIQYLKYNRGILTSDSFTFQIIDDNKQNPLISNIATVNLTVQEIVTPPINNNPEITIQDFTLQNPDSIYSFSISDFLLGAATKGYNAENIKITTLPSFGTLQYIYRDVTLNEVFDTREAMLLTYVRNADAASTDTFTYQLNTKDNVNYTSNITATLNNLEITSTSAAAQNVDDRTITISSMAYGFKINQFEAVNLLDTNLDTILISSLPNNGTLYYGNSKISVGDVFKYGELNNIVYERSSAAAGSESFTFTINTIENQTYSAPVTFTLTLLEYVDDCTPSPSADNVISNVTVNINDIFYPFLSNDFTKAYVGSNTIKNIKIVSLPTEGTLYYGNTPITVNSEFSVSELANLVYEWTDYATNLDSLQFQLNTIENNIYSTMATMTLNISTAVNLPPSQIGALTLALDNSEVHTFTSANFTTDTTPVYIDPEGDDYAFIKITLLPVNGQLQLNGVPLTLNSVITKAEIDSGIFQYLSDSENPDAYVDTFNFSIADAGSNEYLDGGVATLNIAAYVNQPPTVGDATVSIDEGIIYTFTRENFTITPSPDYTDPEGDIATAVRFPTLPAQGVIRLNGIAVTPNQVISMIDVDNQLLTYTQALNAGGTTPTFTFNVRDSFGNWSN